ncbi:MAG: zinc ribbon domain-containing protein [Fidelibacterota bacterium]
MQHDNWECSKCHNTEYEVGQFAATGGGITKFLDIQNKRFTTVTCTQCRYTEIYKSDTGTLENIFDMFTS